MNARLLVALLTLWPALAAAEDASIPTVNVARPDLVLKRESDGCKLIVPFTGSVYLTWNDTAGRHSSNETVACANGFASYEAHQKNAQVVIELGGAAFKSRFTASAIARGIPLTHAVDLAPAWRLDAQGSKFLLFRLGTDNGLGANLYLVAGYSPAAFTWTPCDQAALVQVEADADTYFAQQGSPNRYINAALDMAGLSCPQIKQLTVMVVRDVRQNGHDENRIYTGRYVQIANGWSADPRAAAVNYAFQRRQFAEHQHEQETLKRRAIALAAYREAIAQPERLKQMAALVPELRPAFRHAETFVEPVDAVANARRTGKAVRYAAPVEIGGVNGETAELKWPSPFATRLLPASGVSEPGWYIAIGTLTATGKRGMAAELEIQKAYRCHQERCGDSLEDLTASIYDLPDFAAQVAAHSESSPK